MQLSPWYQRYKIGDEWTTSSRFMCNEYFLEIAKILPSVSKKVVLDLACNAGLVSFGLAQLGATVYGFDKSEHYIDQANFVMKKLHMPRVRFILMDIEELAFEAYEPRLIMLLSVLYHLQNPEKMITRLAASNLDFVASFRPSNCDKFLTLITRNGYKVTKETRYGKKLCFLFTKPARNR